MLYKNMSVAQILTGQGDIRAWEHEINVEAPGESYWLLIPDKINIISVTLNFTSGGSGKMVTSTDKVDVIKNGTPIEQDWPFGEVNTTRQEYCQPCTAIKAVQVNAGTMKVSIRTQ